MSQITRSNDEAAFADCEKVNVQDVSMCKGANVCCVCCASAGEEKGIRVRVRVRVF